MAYVPIPAGTLNWDVPVNAAFTNDDTRLDGLDGNVTFLAGVISILSTQVSALQSNGFGAKDQGLETWTYDPISATTGVPLVGGVLYLCKVVILADTTVSSIAYSVSTIGSGLTAGQNFVALYDATGTRLAVSADQTVGFGLPGPRTAAIPSTPAPAGAYYIAFLANGTTPPQMRGFSGQLTPMASGTTTATPRYASSGAGQTATPASVVITSAASSSLYPWAALN